jgi:hypothetical protein
VTDCPLRLPLRCLAVYDSGSVDPVMDSDNLTGYLAMGPLSGSLLRGSDLHHHAVLAIQP